MRRYGQYPLGWQQFGHLGLTSTFGAFTPGEGVGDQLAALFGPTSGYYPVSLGYVFKDTACTIPCTADGDLIKGRKAQFGGLPPMTQANDSFCPVLKDDGGGRWRADYDGLDDVMESAASATLAVMNLLATAVSRDTNVLATALVEGIVAANNYHRIRSETSARFIGQKRTATDGVFTASSAVSAFPLSTPLVVSSLLNATAVDMQKDIDAAVSTAGATTTPTTSSPIAEGIIGSVCHFWGSAVLSKASISAADRTLVIKALATLQGRTL